MNKMIASIVTLLILQTSFSFGQDLTDKYKKMMHDSSQLTEQNISQNTFEETKKSAATMVGDIQEIRKMKQGTFESTVTFEKRRNDKVLKLKNKIQFYAKNGSKEFSAGTVTMKSYDADSEKMQLVFAWNKELYPLFPEVKKWKTASLDISRNEAKRLFEKNQTHNFHIGVGYINDRLSVSRMMLYNQHDFYANVKKISLPVVVDKRNSTNNNREWQKQNKKVASCDYYYTNASAINVRARPTTRSSRQQKLSINKRVCVVDRSGTWSYIKNKGWVLSSFLSKTKTKRKKKQTSRDRSVWHCKARSTRASGWVERVGKENAKRGAINQCMIRRQTSAPCRIVNCYRL